MIVDSFDGPRSYSIDFTGWKISVPLIVEHSQEVEEYFRALEIQPYRMRRQILAKQNIRPFFYKFTTLDPRRDESVDHTRDVIVRSRLYLSAPGDFNDPFDAKAELIVRGTKGAVEARLRRLVQTHLAHASKAERKARLKTFKAKTHEELCVLAQNAFDDGRNKLGVYCLAGDPLNILMWSHYGLQHVGLCFQFDTARDPRTFARSLTVEYGDTYPIINWLEGFEREIVRAMLTKHENWKYEKESRIIVEDGVHSYVDFKPYALRSIFLGCKITEPIESCLRGLLLERQAAGLPATNLYQAYQHENRYKLVLEKIT